MTQFSRKKGLIVTIIIGICLGGKTFANAGLPVILVTFPAMLLALIPVILIESRIEAKRAKLPYKKIIGPCTLANVITTVLGFPLSWLLITLINALSTSGGMCGPGFDTTWASITTVLMESGIICPRGASINRLLPLTFIVCLCIAYLVSIQVEARILKKTTKKPQLNRKKISIITNSVSYGILVILNLGYFFWIILTK